MHARSMTPRIVRAVGRRRGARLVSPREQEERGRFGRRERMLEAPPRGRPCVAVGASRPCGSRRRSTTAASRRARARSRRVLGDERLRSLDHAGFGAQAPLRATRGLRRRASWRRRSRARSRSARGPRRGSRAPAPRASRAPSASSPSSRPDGTARQLGSPRSERGAASIASP